MLGNFTVSALTNGRTLASECLPTIQVVDKRPMRSCGALVPECIVGNSDVGPLGKIRLEGNIEIGGFAPRLVEGVIGLIGRRGSVRGLSCLRTVPVLGRTEET